MKQQKQRGIEEELDRAELWILARQEREGEIIDEEIKRKAELIVSVTTFFLFNLKFCYEN